MSCIATVFNRYSLKFLDKILQEGPQDSLSGTAPLMSTLYSPRPSPSAFAYCKPSKTEGGNGLEMKLTLGLIDKRYCIAGNFRKFRSFVAIHESFLHKIGVVAPLVLQKRAIRESFLHENCIFHQFGESFLPRKFPAIW